MNVDAAEGVVLIINDDEVVDIMGFIEFEDVDGEHLGGEGDGVGCHDGVDGFFEQVWGFYEVAAQIAVGENTEKFLVGVENGNGAGFGGGHGKDGFADGLSG